MSRRIPDEVVDQIRHSVDIVDVVSEYVQLKKQGRNYFGLCPFHSEGSPSFSVSPEKQIYHCFGCGAGGNAISFVMNVEGATFFDAVKKLANGSNINVSAYEPTEHEENTTNEFGVMIDAHNYMAKYYHHLLMNTEDGKAAMAYLLDRGFSREIIEEFQIGYALDSWDLATRILEKRGFNLTLMEKAGLLGISQQDGNYFDRFRNRIMFPIHNLQGKVVGFSGRTMGDDTPKYMNTPETPIFNKGKLLYHYHFGRTQMRQTGRAILLEGFADVIALHKAGIKETVATMGTALTEEQAKIIRRTVDNVIICYDGDNAGANASLKAAETLTQLGCQVEIATVPEGLDPDDYVNKYGEDKLRTNVIGNRKSVTNFKFQFLRQGKNLQDVTEKISYLDQVLTEVAKLTNPLEITHYLEALFEDFPKDENYLKQRFAEIQKKQPRNKEVWKAHPTEEPTSKRLRKGYENAERFLIAHMLQDEEVVAWVRENLQGIFHTEEHSQILIQLYKHYDEGNKSVVGNFIHKLQENLRGIVSDISSMSINPDVSEKELEDYIKEIKYVRIERELDLKIQELEQAVRNGDRPKVEELRPEIKRLRDEKNRLKNKS